MLERAVVYNQLHILTQTFSRLFFLASTSFTSAECYHVTSPTILHSGRVRGSHVLVMFAGASSAMHCAPA